MFINCLVVQKKTDLDLHQLTRRANVKLSKIEAEPLGTGRSGTNRHSWNLAYTFGIRLSFIELDPILYKNGMSAQNPVLT